MQSRVFLLLLILTAWNNRLCSLNLTLSIDGELRTIEEGSPQHGEPLTAREWDVLDFDSPIPEDSLDLPTKTLLVRFTLNNPTEIENWYLLFADQVYWLEMHTVIEGRTVSSEYSGDIVPMSRRSLYHNLLVLPINLPPNQPADVYIRMMDYQSIYREFSFLTPRTFMRTQFNRNILTSFLISIMFISAVYNLFNFFFRHHKYHLYYFVVLFMLLIAQMGQHRVLSVLFRPNHPYGYFVYIFTNSVAVAAGILFALDFVGFRKTRGIRTAAMVFVTLLSGIAVLSIWYPNPKLGNIMNMVILPVFIGILVLFFHDALSGNKPSRIILLSAAPLLLFAVLDNLFAYLGSSPLWPGRFTQFIGITLHIILMTLAMNRNNRITVDRLRRVRNEYQERTVELSRIAMSDPLSGLLNRACLDETIESLERRQNQDVTNGIIFVDMDNFKYVNDTFGHRKGDAILKYVSGYLKSRTRDSDLVFRYGGDEFLVVMPEASMLEVSKLTERLHSEFNETAGELVKSLEIEGAKLSLSIGACLHSWDGPESMAAAIHNADLAMLEAKKAGKNRICRFSPEPDR